MLQTDQGQGLKSLLKLRSTLGGWDTFWGGNYQNCLVYLLKRGLLESQKIVSLVNNAGNLLGMCSPLICKKPDLEKKNAFSMSRTA